MQVSQCNFIPFKGSVTIRNAGARDIMPVEKCAQQVAEETNDNAKFHFIYDYDVSSDETVVNVLDITPKEYKNEKCNIESFFYKDIVDRDKLDDVVRKCAECYPKY